MCKIACEQGRDGHDPSTIGRLLGTLGTSGAKSGRGRGDDVRARVAWLRDGPAFSPSAACLPADPPQAARGLHVRGSDLGDRAGVVGAALETLEVVLSPDSVDRALAARQRVSNGAATT